MVDSPSCPRCSSPIPPGDASCANCGASLSGVTEAEAPPPGVRGAREATGREPGPNRPKVPDADPDADAHADPDADAHADPDADAHAAVEEAPLARTSTDAAGRRAAAPAVQPAGLRGATTARPRLPAFGPGVNAPSSSGPSGELQPHDPVVAPVRTPATWQVDLRSIAQPPAPPPEVPTPAVPTPPDPEPAGDDADHIPGGYLPPSATYRGSSWTPPQRGRVGQGEQSSGPGMSMSIGAVAVSPAIFGSPLEPVPETPGPAQALIAPSVPAFVTTPAPQPNVAPAAQAPAATPAATLSPGKESVQELVAFGLVASGAVVGFASFFLPWAGSSGIGIGTVAVAGSPPQPNQWAWGMPAVVPLVLLTGLILGAAAGSARARQQLPKLARVIGLVTDVILPMLLGGIYFGVGLLYATLPPQFGYGTGILVLVVGACLLIAGSIVALFFPPADGSVSA